MKVPEKDKQNQVEAPAQLPDPRIERTPGSDKLGKLIRYAIAIGIAVVITVVVLAVREVFSSEMTKAELLLNFTDAFFIAGVVVLCSGALAWSGRQGTFDGIGYWGSQFIQRWTNNRKDWHSNESFSEYKDRKHNPDKQRSIAYLGIVGGVFLVVSIALFIAWSQVS